MLEQYNKYNSTHNASVSEISITVVDRDSGDVRVFIN